MQPKKLQNRAVLKPLRQQLRNNMTPAEVALWKHLQRSQLDGRKSRRQQSIGNFIVDFYCPAEQLVIELDGSPHDTESGWQHDQTRTQWLEVQGLKVLRFENKNVLGSMEGVLELIRQSFK